MAAAGAPVRLPRTSHAGQTGPWPGYPGTRWKSLAVGRVWPLDQGATLAGAKIPHWPRATEYLPGRPNRLGTPAANNVAVEKAKLAENIYKTTNPLKETPGVPEGWKDISNDDLALNKLGLKSSMLYDNNLSPDFLARVYQPDKGIFGKDMNPTVVFRGSRAPEFPQESAVPQKALKGDLSGIKM